MRKQKQPDIELSEVVTEADKIRYSQQIHRMWEAASEEGILGDFMNIPIEDPALPWTSGEYWIMRAKSERERKRLERKLLKNDDR